MRKTQKKILSGYMLRGAGWEALVKSLGVVNATRFLLQSESGFGDYVKTKKQLFKGKSVDDLCKEIEEWEVAEGKE